MKPGGARRGFTLLEVTISIAISSLVMVAVASLMHISGLQVKNIFGQVQMRQTRMAAIDQIRYKLMNARVGSCSLQQNGRYIQFLDLNLSKTMYSSFYFVASEKALYYNKLIGDGVPGVPVIKGPVDVIFTIENPALVDIWVKSASQTNFGEIDSQDGTTKVQLRTLNSAS